MIFLGMGFVSKSAETAGVADNTRKIKLTLDQHAHSINQLNLIELWGN